MRIICPSCATAYDIPPRAIPVDGREVQCSSCTHAWYQLPPSDPTPPLNPIGNTPPPSAPHQSTRSAPSALDVARLREALVGAAPDPAPDASASPTQAARDTGWAPDDSAPEDTAGTEDASDLPPPLRRRLSPEVLKVLRDEASFEAQARQRTAKTTTGATEEADPETPMPDPPWKPQPTEGLQARLRRLRDAQSARDAAHWEPGEEEDHADQQTVRSAVASAAETSAPAEQSAEQAQSSDITPPAAASAPPAQPAPEIDPVRPARLRPRPQSAPQNPQDPPDLRRSGLPMVLAGRELALYVQRQEERRGFQWGFALTAGLFSLAAVLYLSAPALAAAFPAGAPVFDLVILGGERLRDTLILALQALLVRLGAPGAV